MSEISTGRKPDVTNIMKKYFFIHWHLRLWKQYISLCNAMVGIHFAKIDRIESYHDCSYNSVD
jgi:hypothetical protein